MLRLGLVLGLNDHHPELAWKMFTQNLELLIAPHQPFGPFIVAQYGPEIFWNSVAPDQLEAWVKAHVPEEMAPNIARGMETARYKLTQRALLVQSADAFVSRHSALH